MDKEELNLSIHEYCTEDDTLTVHGNFPQAPDLAELAQSAREIYPRIILMEKLKTLVVIAGQATVHIHGNSDLVVNGVRSGRSGADPGSDHEPRLNLRQVIHPHRDTFAR